MNEQDHSNLALLEKAVSSADLAEKLQFKAEALTLQTLKLLNKLEKLVALYTQDHGK